jgi:asparagine synthase (glutamine-hydrolysing)
LDAPDASSLFDRLNQVFTDYEITQFLRKNTRRLYDNFMNDHLLSPENDDLDRVTAVDFKTFLSEDILPKVDRATMFASIEGREPMLDHRVIEFASTLPSSYKLKGNRGKLILRDVVHRYVPSNLVDRPKMGFGLPISQWGTGKLKPLFDECFDEKLIKSQGFFSVKNLRELYDNYQSGNLLSFDRMYVIFIFQQWYRKWMLSFFGAIALT